VFVGVHLIAQYRLLQKPKLGRT